MSSLPTSLARPARLLLPWLLCALPLLAAGAPPPPSRQGLALVLAQPAPPHALGPGQVLVTLSFADTLGTQRLLRAMLARHGLRATFYVNSGRIGRGSYLTLEELRTFAAEGHEIASHTVDHVNPSELPPAEARHQICDDRAELMALGFPITSFAYPFSGDTPAVRQIVIDCGFNNARATGGIRSPSGCGTCPPAESLPPADTFIIRTPPSIRSTYTLADLQSLVLQAEAAGGGWVMISFHGLCADCGTYGVTPELLESFLAWLAPRASRGTLVRTTHQVIGGPVQPPVYADGGTPDAGAPDAGAPDAGAPDGGVPPPSLTVTAPNGGEVLASGTAYALTWTSTGPWTAVDLSWSADRGGSWSAIAFAAPNSGQHTWTVPGTSTSQALVRVEAVGSPRASDTSDAPFSIAPATTGRVIPFGDVWRYEASGNEPGALWYTGGYDDSAWPVGRGQLGYGDGDEATVLPRTTPSQTSVYFRKRLTLSGPVSAAALRVLFDDGIAVWVNGTLAFSRNMDSGLAHARYASASTENALEDVALPAELFVPGENVLGVMVKQVGRTSPDLSFDLQLDVTAPGARPP